MNKYILIADDNDGILDILKTYVSKEGFTPLLAHDGMEAIKTFEEYSPLLILLDVMMPKKDGFEVCREIRRSSNVPIIMITAKGEDADRIMGLDIGADDYIVKPFSPGEVMARIRAILRRLDIPEDEKKDIIRHSDLEINLADYEVKISGQTINLTKKEIEIMWLLAGNPGKVFSSAELYRQVWNDNAYKAEGTVAVHIRHLREKLEINPAEPRYLKVVWGQGYKIERGDN
jgi:DNA-binding response OmpR family regulator